MKVAKNGLARGRKLMILTLMSLLALCLPVAYASTDTKNSSKKPGSAVAKIVRIGYFANVTHAPALVARDKKLIEKYLAKDKTTAQWITFNAGPSAIEAFKGDALDVTYIGPNPSIAGYASTKGSLIRIVAGSTANGAQLIVKSDISTVQNLFGKKIASPQLGNTQDVALRAWLLSKNLKTSISGLGDVTVIPTDNAQSLALFQRGDIDGAWAPEPWASRLVLEANGKVFLDEKDLWPKKLFLTTNIVARTSFLNRYPGTVRSIIQGHIDAVKYIRKSPASAMESVQAQIALATGRRLPDNVIERAWGNLFFTFDPLPSTLVKSAEDAVDAGLLTTLGSRGLVGIYDLRILNDVLSTRKLKKISSQGLGKQ